MPLKSRHGFDEMELQDETIILPVNDQNQEKEETAYFDRFSQYLMNKGILPGSENSAAPKSSGGREFRKTAS